MKITQLIETGVQSYFAAQTMCSNLGITYAYDFNIRDYRTWGWPTRTWDAYILPRVDLDVKLGSIYDLRIV